MSNRTRPPRPRTRSYRDPDLSDKWLDEAEWRAKNSPFWAGDSKKIILRLVEELRKVNRETGR